MSSGSRVLVELTRHRHDHTGTHWIRNLMRSTTTSASWVWHIRWRCGRVKRGIRSIGSTRETLSRLSSQFDHLLSLDLSQVHRLTGDEELFDERVHRQLFVEHLLHNGLRQLFAFGCGCLQKSQSGVFVNGAGVGLYSLGIKDYRKCLEDIYIYLLDSVSSS